ncbi:Major cardiolipin synthase ClsA [Symmachiella dynata]|uniref:Cardiolipin synthase n=1 Tax=Symmachiella dynata TaxID=2527995 RepID=A0A517ZHC2_9PLAN|nr:cardiolipin synthase [Symmachiella dynata]QDU41877.1 Major cardiolipin synthase ClsA [Symmachiella dynata]
MDSTFSFLGLVILVVELVGVYSAVHAILFTRTSQGAIAWAFPLVLFPFAAVPLYWVFGGKKFEGYVCARREGELRLKHITEELSQYSEEFTSGLEHPVDDLKVVEKLAALPFTKHNQVELLVDGPDTFAAIFEGIQSAQDYILIQFFIIHDDEIGRELQKHLLAKLKAGVRVYFLYDGIGCYKLPNEYLRLLIDAGAKVSSFRNSTGWRTRFQLNFRNHRKIVLVDGRSAYVGGHNVGDEYMGRSQRFGHWRDTHVKLTGPAVQCVQLSFLEDWYCATHEAPKLVWEPQSAADGDKDTIVIASGPADELETCSLFFVQAIHSARRRLWITSPYFVPDAQVIAALQLAALRGVDVRILLPEKPDHLLVYLSGFSFVEETEPAGVKFYRYQPGFLHQKVILVDDQFAAVGTANLDNRSFRLNFELTIATLDKDFAAEVAAMLETDFANSRLTGADELRARPWWFKVAVQVSRLMAPVQ